MNHKSLILCQGGILVLSEQTKKRVHQKPGIDYPEISGDRGLQ